MASEPHVPAQQGAHPGREFPQRMVWRRSFPGLAGQAPKARSLLRCLLADMCRADDAEFIAAELINNALLHTRSGEPGGHFTLELVRWPDRVRVGVYDLGGGGDLPGLMGAIAGLRSTADTAEVANAADTANAADAAGAADHGGYGAARELREHGRGLLAVRRLASRVGCEGARGSGHLVWALLIDEGEA